MLALGAGALAVCAGRSDAAQDGSRPARDREPGVPGTTAGRSEAARRTVTAAGRSALLGCDERAREVVGVERAQVLERLADADELDRDAELAGDGQGDPALGGAVELGEDDPVDRDRLGEQLGLAQAVLAGRGVDG